MIHCHSEIQEVLTSKVHLDPGVSEEGRIMGLSTREFVCSHQWHINQFILVDGIYFCLMETTFLLLVSSQTISSL